MEFRLEFANGATGVLNSVWHDNLARPSLRRVEVFCERRHIVIEGDDWFGPVSWTDSDGASGSLEGEALEAAVAPMRDGSNNPDGEFVRAVQERKRRQLPVTGALHRALDRLETVVGHRRA